MICDLAETYRIYDYTQLPVEKVAVFVCGLRDKARIWAKLGIHDVDRELMVMIYDELKWIAWTKTEDAHNGAEPPKRLFNKLFGKETEATQDMAKFKSPEEFKEAWVDIRRRHGNDNS